MKYITSKRHRTTIIPRKILGPYPWKLATYGDIPIQFNEINVNNNRLITRMKITNITTCK